mgnify:FL=1
MCQVKRWLNDGKWARKDDGLEEAPRQREIDEDTTLGDNVLATMDGNAEPLSLVGSKVIGGYREPEQNRDVLDRK